MVFSSSTFIFLFLPVVLIGYFVSPAKIKNAFLVLASLFFYAWGEPKFVIIMVASIIMNYCAAMIIGRTYGKIKRTVLVLAIALNISLLFVFKYLNFVTANLIRIFPEVSVTNISLPIGISFFTFQAISYVVDVYREREKPEKNPINVCLYISFFPQLIAGPIVRYETISKEIADRHTTWNDFCSGFERFLIGLFKKNIIANNVSIIAEAAFGSVPNDISVIFAWLGALGYAFQIYFDFSGYSDMAIGLGRMFGFHFNENFNYPYIASSITEFWRRWHMSLGEWFRDYIYFPLGGSRCKESRHIANLFIVWILTGIWHGANWNFIAWGLWYFAFLVIEKKIILQKDIFKKCKALGNIITLIIVLLGWVLFRADSLRIGLEYIRSMFGLANNPIIDGNAVYYFKEYILFLLVAGICSTPIIKQLSEKLKEKYPIAYQFINTFTYTILFVVAVSYPVMGSHNPFIYFNF